MSDADEHAPTDEPAPAPDPPSDDSPFETQPLDIVGRSRDFPGADDDGN